MRRYIRECRGKGLYHFVLWLGCWRWRIWCGIEGVGEDTGETFSVSHPHRDGGAHRDAAWRGSLRLDDQINATVKS